MTPARHCLAALGRAGEIACRPEAPPALCVRVSALTFPDIPDLHSHFPVAGKRKAADEENAGQGTLKTIKSAAALDDLYPYKAICTATRDGGFAPAWELALYALIFLAQDAVRSTIGKRARGADTASTPCPFANALRAAPFKEKVRADGVHVGCKWSPVGFRLWRSSGRVGDGACACAECSVTCCAGCAVRRPGQEESELVCAACAMPEGADAEEAAARAEALSFGDEAAVARDLLSV